MTDRTGSCSGGCGLPVATFEYGVFKSTDRVGRRDTTPAEKISKTRTNEKM